jgi:hypothetical protein
MNQVLLAVTAFVIIALIPFIVFNIAMILKRRKMIRRHEQLQREGFEHTMYTSTMTVSEDGKSVVGGKKPSPGYYQMLLYLC